MVARMPRGTPPRQSDSLSTTQRLLFEDVARSSARGRLSEPLLRCCPRRMPTGRTDESLDSDCEDNLRFIDVCVWTAPEHQNLLSVEHQNQSAEHQNAPTHRRWQGLCEEDTLATPSSPRTILSPVFLSGLLTVCADRRGTCRAVQHLLSNSLSRGSCTLSDNVGQQACYRKHTAV